MYMYLEVCRCGNTVCNCVGMCYVSSGEALCRARIGEVSCMGVGTVMGCV